MWNDEGRADVYYEVTKITTEKQTEIKTLRDVGYIEYTHNSKNITWGIKLTDKFLKDLNDVDR